MTPFFDSVVLSSLGIWIFLFIKNKLLPVSRVSLIKPFLRFNIAFFYYWSILLTRFQILHEYHWSWSLNKKNNWPCGDIHYRTLATRSRFASETVIYYWFIHYLMDVTIHINLPLQLLYLLKKNCFILCSEETKTNHRLKKNILICIFSKPCVFII